MFEAFKQDARRWIVQGQLNEDAPLSTLTIIKLLYHYLPLRAMAWFRFGNWCKRRQIPFFPSFAQRWIYQHYGLEILIGADIGPGLYIAHPVGVVLAPSRIGENCSVIASVTVGMRNEWEFPEIGDRVFIGAGARVLGGISIGDDAVIGANAVVVNDIPCGATAVGIPARVTRIKGVRIDSGNEPAPSPSITN
ncbi:MAG: serine acetyltransferase [Chloroflexia bacterium]|nr:serine acetyltransferase [Chloroflexia bacterium]